MNKNENIITENIIINFGNNLKKLRLQNNLTLQELSENLGLSRQMLSYYENNKKSPNLYSLIQISKFFNCSIDSLIFSNTDINISELQEVPTDTHLEDIDKIYEKINQLKKYLDTISYKYTKLLKDSEKVVLKSENILSDIAELLPNINSEKE